MKEQGALLKNKNVLAVLSFVVALLGWFLVATLISPTGDVTIQGVGVNIDTQAGLIGEMGLNAIDGGETTVDVVIRGSRNIIGGISAEDISVTASLSGVTGAGTYELDLVAANNSSKDFEIVSVSPQMMKVRFDRLVEKEIPVTYVIEGEYDVPEDYLQEDVVLSEKTITVTGPEEDIESIAGAVATAQVEGTLTQTTTVEAPLTLVDENGETIVVDSTQVSVSAESINVTLPMLKTEKLSFRFEFLNVPGSFNTESLAYTLSADSITVAAPVESINKYSDIFLGYIDMRNITKGTSTFLFEVDLPKGFVNMENINFVEVNFDLTNYTEQTFYAKNFITTTIPVSYNVKINARQLEVMLIGPAEVLQELSSDDIVVEVDLSDRDIVAGQYLIAFRVVIPNHEDVWAEGSYSGAVTVTAR